MASRPGRGRRPVMAEATAGSRRRRGLGNSERGGGGGYGFDSAGDGSGSSRGGRKRQQASSNYYNRIDYREYSDDHYDDEEENEEDLDIEGKRRRREPKKRRRRHPTHQTRSFPQPHDPDRADAPPPRELPNSSDDERLQSPRLPAAPDAEPRPYQASEAAEPPGSRSDDSKEEAHDDAPSWFPAAAAARGVIPVAAAAGDRDAENREAKQRGDAARRGAADILNRGEGENDEEEDEEADKNFVPAPPDSYMPPTISHMSEEDKAKERNANAESPMWCFMCWGTQTVAHVEGGFPKRQYAKLVQFIEQQHHHLTMQELCEGVQYRYQRYCRKGIEPKEKQKHWSLKSIHKHISENPTVRFILEDALKCANIKNQELMRGGMFLKNRVTGSRRNDLRAYATHSKVTTERVKLALILDNYRPNRYY